MSFGDCAQKSLGSIPEAKGKAACSPVFSGCRCRGADLKSSHTPGGPQPTPAKAAPAFFTHMLPLQDPQNTQCSPDNVF